jgi:hypothetical protein
MPYFRGFYFPPLGFEYFISHHIPENMTLQIYKYIYSEDMKTEAKGSSEMLVHIY